MRGSPLAVLRRFRPWLAGAIVIFLILFAGLIRDFSQADVNVGWFTANPAVPLVLVIGYLLMLGTASAHGAKKRVNRPAAPAAPVAERILPGDRPRLTIR